MANPTLMVERFDGSLGSLSGVQPIRYSEGLWLEQAGINYLRNPRATSGTNWTQTRCTVAPDPTVTKDGIPTVKLTVADASGAVRVLASSENSMFAPGDPARERVFLRSGTAGRSATVSLLALTNGGSVVGTVTQTLALPTSGWAEFGVASASLPATTERIGLQIEITGSANGNEVWIALPHGEKLVYSTSYLDGAIGSGYAYTGTATQSRSTRAASSASISPAGILAPGSGSLAFRVTPTIETGLEEIWGECGAKGSGTDHLRWGRDATKHPFVEWSSNDAAYQRLTASETIDAGTETFLYFGHAGTTTSLQVDAGTLQTGSRAAVSASFGAGALTLRASAGGNIVSPFATYDQPLSAARIAIVRDAMANGDDLWTLFEEWEAIIQPTNLLPLQSGEATAGARATVTPATIPLTAQSLTGTSGASAEVEAAELVVAGQAAKAGAIRQLPDTVEWSKP